MEFLGLLMTVCGAACFVLLFSLLITMFVEKAIEENLGIKQIFTLMILLCFVGAVGGYLIKGF